MFREQIGLINTTRRLTLLKKTQLIFVDPRRNLERAYPKYLKVLWGKERPWESIVFFKLLNPLVLLSFLQEHKQF